MRHCFQPKGQKQQQRLNFRSKRKRKKKGNVSLTREHLLRTYAPHPHFKVAAALCGPAPSGTWKGGHGAKHTYSEQKIARKIL